MVRSRATFTPSPARGCTPPPTDVVMMMPVMVMMTISMKMRKITMKMRKITNFLNVRSDLFRIGMYICLVLIKA